NQGTGFYFFCHNCGASRHFARFLEDQDADLYGQYLLERIKEGDTNVPVHKAPKSYATPDPFKDLTPIDQLPPNHYALKYLKERKIPSQFLSKFYFCKGFASFVNSLIPEKFDLWVKDEPRIIIPLKTGSGTVIGFQGRSVED